MHPSVSQRDQLADLYSKHGNNDASELSIGDGLLRQALGRKNAMLCTAG